MFATEKDLILKLKDNYNGICKWNSNDIKILEEVNLGFGIADLVFTRLTSKKIKYTNILNLFDINIYTIIQSKGIISISEIQNITKSNISDINKSINKLILESYINKKDSFLTVKRTYKSIALESIAIEAKLKNWQKALQQAIRYQWFAMYSYVVMDSKFVQPALNNINEFKKNNVGLAEIDILGKTIIHYKPVKRKPIDTRMSIMLNEELKRTIF